MKFSSIFTTKDFIHQARKQATSEDSNLLQASRKLLKEKLIAYSLYYGFWTLSVIGLLAVLSFTDLWGGPFLAAQIILFLVGGTIILLAAVAWWLWSEIKKKLKNFETNNHRPKDIKEATVVDGQISSSNN
ncbi:MAG: hypothetical protein WD335_02910 [Candidatus Paceibacterota bacterium]